MSHTVKDGSDGVEERRMRRRRLEQEMGEAAHAVDQRRAVLVEKHIAYMNEALAKAHGWIR